MWLSLEHIRNQYTIYLTCINKVRIINKYLSTNMNLKKD